MRKFSLQIWFFLTIFSIPEMSFANMQQLADRAYQNGASLVALMALRDEMLYTPGPCHGPSNQISGTIEPETTQVEGVDRVAEIARAAAWLDIRKEPVVLSLANPVPSPLNIRAIDATGTIVFNQLIVENAVTKPITFSQKMTKAGWIFLQIETQIESPSNEQSGVSWRQWLQQVVLLPESQFNQYQSLPLRRVQLVREVTEPLPLLPADGLKFFMALNRALYENPGLAADWMEFEKIGVKASPALGLVSVEPEIKEVLRNTPARNPHVNGIWNRQGICW